MLQGIIFLNHKAIGTLYFRNSFRTSSFRLSYKNRETYDPSIKEDLLKAQDVASGWIKGEVKERYKNTPFQATSEDGSTIIAHHIIRAAQLQDANKFLYFSKLFGAYLNAKTFWDGVVAHVALCEFLEKEVKHRDEVEKRWGKILSKAVEGKR